MCRFYWPGSGSQNRMLNRNVGSHTLKGRVLLGRTRSAIQINIGTWVDRILCVSQVQSLPGNMLERQVYSLYGDDIRRVVLVTVTVDQTHQSWVPALGSSGSGWSLLPFCSASIAKYLTFIFLSPQRSSRFFSFWTEDELVRCHVPFKGHLLCSLDQGPSGVYARMIIVEDEKRASGLTLPRTRSLPATGHCFSEPQIFFHVSNKENDNYLPILTRILYKSKWFLCQSFISHKGWCFRAKSS